MASLRDVLNHIGLAARIDRAGAPLGAVKAIRRGTGGFCDATIEPAPGDTLVFQASGERFRIAEVFPELVRERVDHYRLTLLPL